MERFFSEKLKRLGKIAAVIEIGRPWNGLFSGFLAILGFTLGGFSFLPALGLFILFTIAYIAGSTVNDIFDQSIDKLNMPFRPLQEGRIKRSSAKNFSILMHVLTLLIALIIDTRVFIITVIFFIFSTFYSVPPLQFSRRGILSQIELSFTIIFIPLYAGSVLTVGTFLIPPQWLLFFISFYLLGLFVLLLKDFKDIKGDKEENKKTAVIQLGEIKTQLLSIIGTVASFYLIFKFFTQISPLDIYYTIATLTIMVILILTESKVRKIPEAVYGMVRIVMVAFVFILIMTLF